MTTESTTTTHTPAEEPSVYDIIRFASEDDPRLEAAAILADAAPALLDALKGTIRMLEALISDDDDDADRLIMAHLRISRAAIAQATGEAQ